MLNCAENTSSLRMTSYLISGVWDCMRHEQREDRTLRPWGLWVGPGGLSKYQQVCLHSAVQQYKEECYCVP